MKQEMRRCQNCEQDFIIEPEDFVFYKKVQVPPPTWCPECRLIRRLLWVNSNNLYVRSLDSSDKKYISMYSEDKLYNIVKDEEWWKDAYNILDYGMEYDFSKPMFEQFRDLMERVPLPHLQRSYTTMIQSEYCNAAAGLKNCYLVFMADQNEDSAYCYSVENLKDCIDVSFSHRNELCSQSTDITRCYNCHYSQDIEDSSDLFFCKNCVGCSNCFGCVNLKNKQYYIFNKPYSKEEYARKIKEFDFGSFKNGERLKEEAQKVFLSYPQKYMRGRKNENVEGDYIFQSKNIKHSFTIGKSENCKYSHFLKYVTTGTKDAYDYTMFGVGAELVYDTAWCGIGINNVKFSFWNYGSQNIEYCFGCHSSKNLFACIGLRHKQYCILNKQYTKESFDRLRIKIKEQMNEMPYVDKKGRAYKYGEFFPPELSPFAYNETTVQEYFPLTKDEAVKQGYNWKDKEKRNFQLPIFNFQSLPDHIREAGDDIMDKVISCAHEGTCNEQCTEAFRIIPQELKFYRKMSLPLPRLCPNCRHRGRIKQRNPLQLWHRTCMCGGGFSVEGIGYSYENTAAHFHGEKPCPNEFETSYTPERKEIVYCEACYLQEVV